ncbi:MAG: DUF177 domain-containing protein [Pseudomonadota bacterium]
MTDHQPGSELARIVDCRSLNEAPRHLSIKASAAERKAIADRLDLLALESLEAEITLEQKPGGRVAVKGTVKADAKQACIVSLEPVAANIEEVFSILYCPEAAAADADHRDLVLQFEDDDWPEPMDDHRIDVGEAVVQQMALALDPYPRAPGAALTWYGDDEPGGEPSAGANPFRDLARSKKMP